MKKIICFGDSNTFGFNPKDGSRYDSDTRWTGILAKILGNQFKVIEEGCNNRTGFVLNSNGPMQVMQCGQMYLPRCLEKHDFDVFILALGTNDLQKFFEIDENIVKEGLKNIIENVRSFNKNSRIIMLSPVILSDCILNGYFRCQFDENSIRASVWIQNLYEVVAQKENCEFLDLNKYVKPSTLDGLHFDAESHKIIAEKVGRKILGDKNNIDSKSFAGSFLI